MKDTSIYYDILDIVRTKQEMLSLNSKLEDLSGELFKSKGEIGEKLDKFLDLEQKEKLMSFCQKNNIKIDDPAQLSNLLEKLTEELKKLPMITIYLAFEPKEETIVHISDWFLINLNQRYILDINIDKSLVAGSGIVFNGTYKDFSARKKIEELEKQNKLTLSNLLS